MALPAEERQMPTVGACVACCSSGGEKADAADDAGGGGAFGKRRRCWCCSWFVIDHSRLVRSSFAPRVTSCEDAPFRTGNPY